jgi:hypothetical protein
VDGSAASVVAGLVKVTSRLVGGRSRRRWQDG